MQIIAFRACGPFTSKMASWLHHRPPQWIASVRTPFWRMLARVIGGMDCPFATVNPVLGCCNRGAVARIISILLLAIFTVGCATVVRGTSDQLQFLSDPPGAIVTSVIDYECGGPCPQRELSADDSTPYQRTDIKTPPVPGPSCITPCIAQVSRNKPLIVTFTKAGYRAQRLKVRTKLSGQGAAGAAGNILLGGAVGLATDTVTGAALDHCPNPVTVHLVPSGKTAAPMPDAIADPCA
jgi:hypothetical protein